MKQIIFLVIGLALRSEAKVQISEIENLAMGKAPVEAIKKIVTFFADGSTDAKDVETVKKISTEIFNTFYTEQALNHFEVGRHLMFKDPAEAQSALEKAMELEPVNGKIFLLWSRVSLGLKNCTKVLNKSKEMSESYPYITEVNLITGQALACQEKSDELKMWLDKNSKIDLALTKYISHLWLQHAFLTKDLAEQKRWLETLKKQDGDFPEIYFWQWKMAADDSQEKDAVAKKYLNQCKKMSDMDRRKYLMEPITCHAVKEVKEKQKNV